MSKEEKSSDCVQVALRIRPFVQSEIDQKCSPVVIKIENEPQVLVNAKKSESFTFNNVFDCSSNQEQLYEESVKKMLEKLFSGYNITILAYGQTGSGKTYTMGTNFSGNQDETMGVIPRATHDIFEKVEELKETHKAKLKCSFIELYQEQLYDLLNKSPRDQCIVDIREDVAKGIIIPGLTEQLVNSAKETIECLKLGSSGRTVGATAMNQESSRSHAIFTIKLEIEHEKRTTVSRFHLVDLAGSERSKKTLATGDRFKEGVNINRGLLALGNVISALGSSNNGGYISYRDSKLTRLLQDSLGGNSITLMIACVSPANYNIEETLNTLKYADRAKRIKNKPIINQDPLIAKILKLQSKFTELETELASLQKHGNPDMNQSLTLDDLMKTDTYLSRVAEKEKMTNQMHNMLDVIANLELRVENIENIDASLVEKFKLIKTYVDQLDLAFQSENCPAHIVVMRDIRENICEISEIIQKLTGHIDAHYSMPLMSNRSSKNEEEFENHRQSIVLKEYLNKIGDINNEIGGKQLDHERAIEVHKKMLALENDSDIQSQINEYQMNIQSLEEKKSELTVQLVHKSKKTVASDKLAVDRLKQIETLEKKIKAENKRMEHFTHKLEMRKKDAEQIKVLQDELTSLKRRKVELIKEMKKISEAFKKEKKDQEREMLQLKEATRKKEVESIREARKHTKHTQVLNMKLQKANAINARIANLEQKRQNVLKMNMSKRSVGTKYNFNNFKTTLKSHINTIESQTCYQQLIEYRNVLQTRLKTLQSNCLANSSEIAKIETELETAKSNIIQARNEVPETSKFVSQLVSNVTTPEQREEICQFVFIDMINSQTNDLKIKRIIEEKSKQCEENEQTIENLEHIKKQKNFELQVKLESIKEAGEKQIQKIFEVMNKTQLEKEQQIQEYKERKLQELNEELYIIENENEELHQVISNEKSNLKRPRAVRDYNTLDSFNNISDIDSDMDIDIDSDLETDNVKQDPDWRLTPFKLQSNKSRSTINISSENESLFKRETRKRSTITVSTNSSTSNSSTHGCKCRHKCITKRCSCRKLNESCSSNCQCGDECQNKIVETEHKSDDECGKMMENLNETFEIKRVKLECIENKPPNTKEYSPMKIRLSDDTFNCTSPSYPFAKRQYIPIVKNE